MKLFFITIVVFFALALNSYGTVINVPEDFSTIQEGINSAVDGDTVLVQPGTYFECIVFDDKNITLGSLFLTTGDTTYIEQTVIDGSEGPTLTPAVTFSSNGSSDALLTGFEITNGNYSGIRIESNSNPTLSHLLLQDNSTPTNGGGIYCESSSATLTELIFTHNFASANGSGIYATDSGISISNCTFFLWGSLYFSGGSPSLDHINVIDSAPVTFDASTPTLSNITISQGDNVGSLFLLNGTNATISNAIINGNTGYCDGAGLHMESSHAELTDVTISNNASWFAGPHERHGGGVYAENSTANFTNVMITGNNTQGNGGGLYLVNSDFAFTDVVIRGNECDLDGGGMYLEESNPTLNNVIIEDNFSDGNGGGLYLHYSNPVLSNTNIIENRANGFGGGFYFSTAEPVFDSQNKCNIYLNNAAIGKDLFAFTSPSSPPINVVIDTFTVQNPTDYHVYPAGELYNFDISNYIIEQIDSDLYVNPDGDDTNSGLTPESPLQSISHALSIITSDTDNPKTIYLAAGTYDYQQNNFPIGMISNLSLQGESEENTIIRPYNTGSGILYYGMQNSSVQNLTITNASANLDGDLASGGGINCINSSNIALENITITDCAAQNKGGGIRCDNSQMTLESITITENQANSQGGGFSGVESDIQMNNVIISNNSCDHDGGGLYAWDCQMNLANITLKKNEAQGNGGGICLSVSNDVVLSGVKITENTAQQGGGIFTSSSPDFDTDNRCDIFLNHAGQGNDIRSWNSANVDVVVDTFTVPEPTNFNAYPIQNFTFDILNSIVQPVSSDLYVSPYGNDSNTGLSAAEPLKTISMALLKIEADSENPHTIFIDEGTYSPSETGENYPLNMINYVSLQGDNQEEVILDAESQNRLIHLEENTGVTLSNLSLINGESHEGEGGGIYASESSADLVNLTIENCRLNEAETLRGGGLYSMYSTLNITGCTFRGNYAGDINGGCFGYGGGLYLYHSNTHLENVNIFSNKASIGGGICDRYSEDHSGGLELFNVKLKNNRDNPIDLTHSDAYIKNTLIAGNTGQPGAIKCWYSNPTIENTTIANNIPYSGNPIGAIDVGSGSNPVIKNSILWNEGLPYEVYHRFTSEARDLTLAYNSIRNGQMGVHANGMIDIEWIDNIENDPKFVDPIDPEIDLHLLLDSPCIDAGDPESDYSNEPTPNGGRINMGFYGNTNEAAISINPISIPATTVNSIEFSVPVTNNYAPEQGTNIELAISYNTEIVEYTGYSTANTQLENWNIYADVNEGNGEVFFQCYSSSELLNMDYDVLLNLSFNAMIAGVEDTIHVDHAAFGAMEVPTRDGIITIIADIKVVDDFTIDAPSQFVVEQNYPNPFNPTTAIKYGVPEESHITINIYDISGKLIKTLVDDTKKAGYHSVIWNGENQKGQQAESGIYVYRITGSNGFAETKRMTLLK